MSTQNPDNAAGTTTAIEDRALDKESLIEFLGEDDGKEQETLELEDPAKKVSKDKKEGKDKEEGDEKTGDEKELSLEEELEQELEEPEVDDDLDLVAPPSRREILTKYPNVFKDFPQLEKSLYRDRKYSELLPTIKDAQEAVNKSNLLDKYENEVVNGSTESFLSTIRDNDKEAFAKVVDNYLPNLFKVDQGAYWHTIGNVIKHAIMSMVKSSKDSDNEELGNAAAVINNFIFGSNQFTYPSTLSKQEVVTNESRQKEDEISKRERALIERQFASARDSLGTTVDNIVKATVDRAIDPNNSMTEYVKGKAIQDVLESLESAFESDTRFRSIFDRLWENAFDKNFSSESMDRIKKAYLSKAKTLLPYLIRKSRTDALKGNRPLRDTGETKDKRGPLPVGKNRPSAALTSGKATGNTTKQTIPKGMTTLEFLNSDD